jgi:hypothetical protein
MRQRGVAVFEVVLHLTIASIVVSLVVLARNPGWKKKASHREGNGTQNVGMAASSCRGDKRFFPHIGNSHGSDDDVTADTATPVLRTLVFEGRCDDPEPFVRPSSPDAFQVLPSDPKRD